MLFDQSRKCFDVREGSIKYAKRNYCDVKKKKEKERENRLDPIFSSCFFNLSFFIFYFFLFYYVPFKKKNKEKDKTSFFAIKIFDPPSYPFTHVCSILPPLISFG